MTLTDHFQLGLFGANATGIGCSRAPERWLPTWDNNLTLARMAEDAGLDFHLPLARWKGMGGASDPLGVTLDSIPWAAALAAVTRSIRIYATVHAPFMHPVVAAKQLATVDVVSGGRVALNIVSGWRREEFDMLGLAMLDHDERYEYSREWVDVVTALWSRDEPFDYHGRFFHLDGVAGHPKPVRGHIPLMSAGSSSAGRRFATSRCDALFIIVVYPEQGRAEVEAAHAAARQHGRHIDVYTAGYVVCRPTQKEAEGFHRYMVHDMVDDVAVDALMSGLGMSSQSFSPEHYQMFRERFTGGHGNYPIVGDPDHVAAEIGRLRDAGLRGLAMGMLDYAQEFPYFRDEVLPRLERMGVRTPAPRPA